ncbi:MAG: hypothetical protein DBX55_03960 [Verrucomicrobia bacterium]|nr:MAG: hypothetical protein DBX55_03960 [Verrucomicrobiota bacterium]
MGGEVCPDGRKASALQGVLCVARTRLRCKARGGGGNGLMRALWARFGEYASAARSSFGGRCCAS